MSERLPFQPVPRDFPGHPMPASVPPGMRLELSRCPIKEGQDAVFEEWMAMLNARRDEARETLAGERMAFEASFVHTEADGSRWMYHLQLFGDGDGGGELTAEHPLDRDHAAYSERAAERGWEELEPRLLLVPEPVERALLESAGVGSADDSGTGVDVDPDDIPGADADVDLYPPATPGAGA